jgi:uncharacterized protein
MTEKKYQIVSCPTCAKPVQWRSESTFRPFCSERCKLIDLGEWAAEKYKVRSSEGLSEDEFGEGHT